MATTANRLILIGLDGLNPELLGKLVEEQKVPSIARIVARGALAAALSAPPLDTPTNWTVISTGAWPGTHGITSFGIHLPGNDLGDPLAGAFNTNLCQAEYLWDVAERIGKRTFIFDYPVSWPPTVRHGIVMRPTTMGGAWNPGYLWRGMGSFGDVNVSDADQTVIARYPWERIYETAELSVHPDTMRQTLFEKLGPPPRQEGGGGRTQSFVEFARRHAAYLADVAAYLQHSQGWDLLMCHLHAPDTLQHMLQNALWPEHPDYQAAEASAVWDIYAHTLRALDDAIGQIVEQCADERTIVALVSDHGSLPCWKAFWVNNALRQAGLLAYRDGPDEKGSWVDWKRTQAINSFTATEHIWVNLRGRQPNGSVAMGREYEQVRERVLQALYDVRDPDTGECPVALALRKEDAISLGHWGDRCSDVLVFAKPQYYVPDFNHFRRLGGEEAAVRQLATLGDRVVEPFACRKDDGTWLWSWHAGGYHHGHMPNAALGNLTNRAFFLAAGPGIRAGYRRDLPINLVDVAPTLTHVLDWPAPRHAEGAVRHDLLERGRS